MREHLVGFAADQPAGDSAAAAGRHENQVALAHLRRALIVDYAAAKCCQANPG